MYKFSVLLYTTMNQPVVQNDANKYINDHPACKGRCHY